ncbi:MAG: hypothetical protein IH608_01040, partial [Proteobacteria bacterium]|nr:hypothetical protein [Pseudomonadota bacterium]
MHPRLCLLALLSVVPVLSAPAVTFRTSSYALEVNGEGEVCALRQGGIDYLAEGQPAPLLQVRAGGVWHRPERMDWDAASARMRLEYGVPQVQAEVRAEAKPSHVVFELCALEPVDRVEVVLWGPYPTSIGETVGETVGVVRNAQSALGIQALNAKTLGGFPASEDDVMPMYDIFSGGDYSDIAAEQRDRELYRGDTAKPVPFGSVLQAYCRNRSQERVIA